LAIDPEGRFFILARVDADQFLIQDPCAERPQVLSIAEFAARWTGELILFTSRASLAGELAKFDFTWFIPAVVKYRKLLGEVLLVSFVLQLFALVTPLFFQVVMDKVLVHRGLTTLDVIAIGLLVVMLFEVVLSGIRSYVFAHTTSRIDVELGARLFRHLLNLPLAYFQARRVGDTVARVRELENIRQFLTGNAITLVLDLLFSVVFIGVMLLYSGWLTLVVVLSLPCYVLLSVGITPLLRARLHEKFNRGAENQAFLVEAINGIDTVKAMAVEPQMIRNAGTSSSPPMSRPASAPRPWARWRMKASLPDRQAGHAGDHVARRAAGDRRQPQPGPVDRLQHARRSRRHAGHAPRAALDRLPADRHLGAALWATSSTPAASSANRRGRAAGPAAPCRRWPAGSNSTRWSSATAPTRRKCCAA
jgi:hypothetical protein